MYLPAHFRLDDEQIPMFIELNPLATLVSVGENGAEINYAPMIFKSEGHLLLGHLANTNPHLKLLGNNEDISAIFHGENSYISPNWYDDKTQVPTWNFMNVEVKGKVRLITDDGEKYKLLNHLSNHFERQINSDWVISKVPEAKLTAMIKAITGFAIEIDSWVGKAKLSQNKSNLDRANLIAGLDLLGDERSKNMARLIEKV